MYDRADGYRRGVSKKKNVMPLFTVEFKMQNSS